MNSGFAGSASHDDRRRRRLLSEQSGDAENSSVVFAHDSSESRRNHRYPLKRLVHYKAWRMWAIAFLLVASGAGLLYASWIQPQRELGEAFDLLFHAETGRIYPAIWMGTLFLAGQLSWLIGWARSRSLNDFRGHFRVWRYIGLTLFITSFAVAIRADELISLGIAQANVELPWQQAELNWMIPLGSVSLLMAFVTDREMRISRIARWHLWLSLGLLSAGLSLPLISQMPEVPVLVEQGLILGGLMLFAVSLLWFCRQVLYFSADPAAVKTNLLVALLKKIRLPKRQSKVTDDSDDESETTEEQTTKRRPKRRQAAKQPAAATTEKQQAAEPASKETKPEPAKPAPSKTPIPKPHFQLTAQSIAVSDIDEEILQERMDMMQLLVEEGESLDPELLKGLTKKQKKQMRNYWRDLERDYSSRQVN